MRILYLCHRIPYPPDKGEKIRAFHQIRAIAARHEVDLFTLADDPRDLAHRPALLEFCRSVTVAQLNPRLARLRSLPFLFSGQPLTVPYFYSSELDRAVRQAISTRSYDRIFVYCSAMAQYVEAAGGIPVVTDFVDADSDKWRQYSTFTRWPFSALYRREARTLRAYERRVCELSASVVVTTGREARIVSEIAGQLASGAPVHVVPNGVDTDYFRPPDPAGPAPPGTAPPAHTPTPATAGNHAPAPTVGFTGDMSYFPNEEAVTYFASKVLPLIRQSLPTTQFLIVGRNPTANVRKLALIPGIEVTGFVPDIRACLARTQVSVAPFSIAAGIQNKILEAMAFGLPVVGTSRAAQGLSAEAALAMDIADTAEEMAKGIVRLLNDPAFARSRGMEGRRRVTAEYNWQRSLERLLQLIEEPSGAAMSWKSNCCQSST